MYLTGTGTQSIRVSRLLITMPLSSLSLLKKQIYTLDWHRDRDFKWILTLIISKNPTNIRLDVTPIF